MFCLIRNHRYNLIIAIQDPKQRWPICENRGYQPPKLIMGQFQIGLLAVGQQPGDDVFRYKRKACTGGYFNFPAHYELVRKMHSCGLNRCVPVGTHGGVGGRQANYSLASYPIVQHKARKSILCHIFPFSKIFECCSDLGFSYSCFLPFKTAHWNRKRSNLSHWKFPFL